MLCIEIVVNSHGVTRNNIDRTLYPLLSFPPMVTSCKTVVQCHIQDVDIDAVQIQIIFFK